LTFRSGFVNIIGRPNVGKSTLMNALVKANVSIITFKPQTTRHRIQGILNGDDFQIVFSDTPGFVHDPSYRMHEKMNRYVHSTFEDADVMLLIVDHKDVFTKEHVLVRKLPKLSCPIFLVLNKMDLLQPVQILMAINAWKDLHSFQEILPVSALTGKGVRPLFDLIKANLPEGPKYFPEDQLSNRPERFFVSEIVREQIFIQYRDEIPYSCEVAVESFKEESDIIRIEAYIFVNRKSQKPILIGKNAEAIKKLGTHSREKMEDFFSKKIFLSLRVKVRENWRDNDNLLDKLGYSR